jgi:hypothetical protein
MNRGLIALAALIAVAAASLSSAAVAQAPKAGPAAAPALPKNPNIEIVYVAPRDPKFQPIYQRIRDLQVFETLQQFLAPLKLPRKIVVGSDECGAMRYVYRPGGPAVICYEYILAMEQAAPGATVVPIANGRITREGVIVGAFVNEVLSQVALAIFDALQIPVWGNSNDAADSVAALIMSQFGEPVAWRTLVGTSWFLAQRAYIGRGTFSEVLQTAEAPRFYNYLCIAYSANPDNFSFLTADIPKDRLEWCQNDYRKLVRSFVQTIWPHVDRKLLEQTRKVDWMTRMQMTKN